MNGYTFNDHFGDEEDTSGDLRPEKSGDDYSDNPTSLSTMSHRQYHY